MTVAKFSPSSNSPFFNSFLEDFFGHDSREVFDTRTMRTPAVNIKESENGFDVEVAAPGLNKDDFKIELEGDRLTVSAAIEHKNEEKTEKYFRKEFGYQSFKRNFTLPKTVDRESIKANYENGVLHLNIPKKEVATPTSRLIEIG